MKYLKNFLLKDINLFEDNILIDYLNNMSANDILKKYNKGGYLYNKAKSFINKLKESNSDIIEINNNYLNLKHKNSRKLYKLIIFFNNPKFLEKRYLGYKYNSYIKRAYAPAIIELEKYFNLNITINKGIHIKYNLELFNIIEEKVLEKNDENNENIENFDELNENDNITIFINEDDITNSNNIIKKRYNSDNLSDRLLDYLNENLS
jgi:hypothetical protein